MRISDWSSDVCSADLLCVVAKHYTSMQAMQMSPAINYDPSLFAASIVIAVTASFAELKLAFHLRGNAFGVAILSKIGSAVLMGIAITGMHYTGMAADRKSTRLNSSH